MRLAPFDEGLARHHLEFGYRRVQIVLDIVSTLVGVDPEVAEMAPFTTKWNVVVEPKRNTFLRRLIVDFFNLPVLAIRPKRKWWIV